MVKEKIYLFKKELDRTFFKNSIIMVQCKSKDLEPILKVSLVDNYIWQNVCLEIYIFILSEIGVFF